MTHPFLRLASRLLLLALPLTACAPPASMDAGSGAGVGSEAPPASEPTAGSAGEGESGPTAAMEAPGGMEAARDFLPSGEPEADGFGLYSYLLFGSPPASDRETERYRAAVRALLAVPEVHEMRMYAPDSTLNLTYLPLARPPADTSADSLLAAYDYARARAIIRNVPELNDARDGPYFVSAVRPLTRGPSPGPRLVQNLTAVPPKLVGAWVDHFLAQAQRPGFWQGEAEQNDFALSLRTALSQAAEGLPEVQGALGRWIVWIRENNGGG
jgi:hypothetical protein